MNFSTAIKRGQIVKTHELVVIDPETRKCRRITPAKTGQLFVLQFDGVYANGETKVVDELRVNMGEELAGCPV